LGIMHYGQIDGQTWFHNPRGLQPGSNYNYIKINNIKWLILLHMTLRTEALYSHNYCFFAIKSCFSRYQGHQ
jgi:hypothetical protein